TSVTIPASIKFIGEFAFAADTNITSIYSYARNPVDLKDTRFVFYDIDKNSCTLYVPFGSKGRYAQASQWKDFVHIVEMKGFELQQTTTTLEATQGSHMEIALKGNTGWTATSDQPWLTVSPASGTGDQMLTFTAQANTEGKPRVATVTVSAFYFEPQTVTVTQNSPTVGLMDEITTDATIKNYPNPFTQQMTIEIANPSLKEVTVEIYTLSGQKIKTLLKGQKGAKISCTWDGGDIVPGVYLLKVNGETRKVVKD
ncbi:MAG: BACON domain-containing protein, partial [Candidatus Saccharibacteria bacterium]